MITVETIVTAIQDTIKEIEQKAKEESLRGNHDISGILYLDCYAFQALLDNINSLERGV